MSLKMALMFSKMISLGMMVNMTVELDPVVTTKTGKYRGLPPDDFGVVAFLGIPFAEPPIGSRRFKPTELISPHADVMDVTTQTPVCPQLKIPLPEKLEAFWGDYEQSENCLYLDVYVPKSTFSGDVVDPKAVLVFIHGGGYTIGFKNNVNVAALVGMNDVIVVTINYRLGVLGFMTTGDENAVGNYGLMDQIVALEWIQQNIEGFGGDKNRVTISGESAGGASVAQLAVSPASKGLVHRVIAQSGSAVAFWSEVNEPVSHAIHMANGLNCPTNSTKELVECLREVPVEDLLEFQQVDPSFLGPKWGPVYNNNFFPFTLEELKTSWENLPSRDQLLHTDLMIGVCTEEGAMLYEMMEKLLRDKNLIAKGEGMSEGVFKGILGRMAETMVPEGGEMLASVLPSILYRYTDWTDPEDEYAHTKMFVKFLTEAMFSAPAIQSARLHAELTDSFNDTGSESPVGRTFFYSFDQTGSWMATSPWRSGADHGDDLYFMSGFTFLGIFNATDEEKLFSRKTMKYWTNFAKTGDPNEPITDELPLPKWPDFESEDEKYLVLDANLSADSVKTRLLSERVAFWLDFIPKQKEALEMSWAKCSKDE